MRRVASTLAVVASIASSAAFAQSAVIDLSAKPRPFAQADYHALVKCSLEKHPETTKRYATYHLVRRDTQTWQENERDPDSRLMMPSLEGCIDFKSGEPIPFSLDSLIADWGKAHNVRGEAEQPKVADLRGSEATLATCMWAKAPRQAKIAMETDDQMKFFMALVRGGEACGFRSATVEMEKVRLELRSAQPQTSKD